MVSPRLRLSLESLGHSSFMFIRWDFVELKNKNYRCIDILSALQVMDLWIWSWTLLTIKCVLINTKDNLEQVLYHGRGACVWSMCVTACWSEGIIFTWALESSNKNCTFSIGNIVLKWKKFHCSYIFWRNRILTLIMDAFYLRIFQITLNCKLFIKTYEFPKMIFVFYLETIM